MSVSRSTTEPPEKYATVCSRPGSHAAGTSSACASISRSPEPSPATTRRPLAAKYAIRVSVRVPSQRGDETSRRGNVQRTSPSSSSAMSAFRVVATR